MPRAIISYLTEQEYSSRKDEFVYPVDISSKEDAATLVETVEVTSHSVPVARIKDIVGTKDGKYVCVISPVLTYFDLFAYLNEKLSSDVYIGCANVRFLFPRHISRGLYEASNAVDTNTDDISEDDEDDTPTGYLDVEDLPQNEEMGNGPVKERYLVVPETGAKLPIDENGIIIGRSSSRTDYAISNSKISRVHAKIYKKGNKYMVHDYDSANGTFIDGLRVRENNDREISPGSKLVLANSEFKLV